MGSNPILSALKETRLASAINQSTCEPLSFDDLAIVQDLSRRATSLDARVVTNKSAPPRSERDRNAESNSRKKVPGVRRGARKECAAERS